MILKKIIENKKIEVKKAKKKLLFKDLIKLVKNKKIKPKNFHKAIRKKSTLSIIGEIKRASPSKGYLNKNIDIVKTAKIYEKSRISAISILTDKHFKGSLQDLRQVRKSVRIPILRKDFIIDKYQVYESLYNGADAILLIAACLSKKKLNLLLDTVHKLKMHAIIEIHNEKDLKKIDFKKTRIIGINNRNLKNFSVDTNTTYKLKNRIPKKITVISESGLSSFSELKSLKKNGIKAVLIGEALVKSNNVSKKIKQLLKGK